MTREEIKQLQVSLNQSGFAYSVSGSPLVEDGIYGPQTDYVHRAWLDQDDRVPTVTPTPARPWWQSRAILGILTSVIAAVVSRWGWSIDHDAITDLLFQAIEFGGLAVATWGTVNRPAPVDPTLVARFGTRDVRLPDRVPLRPNRQADDDPRGLFRDS